MNIDKETLLKALRNGPGEGLRSHELAAAMAADLKGRHRLRTLLDTLVDHKVVEKAPGNRYRLVGTAAPEPPPGDLGAGGPAAAGPLPKGWVAGSLRVHPAGYGFVARDDGEDDVFVAARNRGHALDGDRVAISTWLGYKGTEGRVEEVLARGRAKLTGILRGRAAASYLEPDDPRIAATGGHVLLDAARSRGRRQGRPGGGRRDHALPDARRRAARRRASSHVLGDPDDPRTEIEKILSAPTSRPSSPRTCCKRPSARPRRCAPRISPIASICATAPS